MFTTEFLFKYHFLYFSVLQNELFIEAKKHFGGAFVNLTHSTIHVPTIIYSLSKLKSENKLNFKI